MGIDLVWSAVLLTVTGAMAWWLGPVVNREKMWGERKIFLVLHLTLFFLLHAVLHQTGWKERVVGSWFHSRVDRILAHHFEPLKQHPTFTLLLQNMQSSAQVAIVPAYLGMKGVPKLSPQAQATRATLLRSLVESAENTTLCTNLLRGKATAVEIEAHLDKLTDEQLHLWGKLRADSAKAVLENYPTQTADKAQIQAALSALGRQSTREDFIRLVNGLLHRNKTEAAEACWVLRTLYEHIQTLPAPHSHALAMLLNLNQ